MKEILINVLFLLIVLLITQHSLEVYKRSLSKKFIKIYVLIASLISILFCMSFPFDVNEDFAVDLRVVPYLVGSLYGGPLVSIGLYGFIVVYRFLIGVDPGFFGTILNHAFIPFFTLIFHKRFIKSRIKQKLLIATGIVLFQLLLSHFIYTYIFVSNTPLAVSLLGAFIKIACVLFFILTVQRIYSNYKIRNEMINMEKMETLSHLSASISHEIRNGLTGAKGFMQLLNESEHDPDKKRYIKIALKELQKSEDIIRDFLTFAKPAPEKIEKINMEHLLNDIIELNKPLLNINSIDVKKDLTPFWIIGEKRLIQQAILNIFKNAIEAMPNGGNLTVVMKQNEHTYEISIQDSGFGMDQEQIERLGKPYFTTKGQKGTGLGMMVTYRVIEQLKGKINVKSQIDKGTTFTISFPHFYDKSDSLEIEASFSTLTRTN